MREKKIVLYDHITGMLKGTVVMSGDQDPSKYDNDKRAFLLVGQDIDEEDWKDIQERRIIDRVDVRRKKLLKKENQ